MKLFLFITYTNKMHSERAKRSTSYDQSCFNSVFCLLCFGFDLLYFIEIFARIEAIKL